ncbi:MAG: hypothetical protein FJ134_10470 [Deltaproteobacteria bacterium]|nr:hypothetical protein [Deltaproteobacteria bacterium]
MATCKWCNKSGWFLSLTANGLCKNCDPIVVLNVSQATRIINESVTLIEKSNNLDTQLSRCNVIIIKSEELLPYEQRHINTINPKPSELISQYIKKKDDLILKSIDQDLDKIVRQIPFSDNHKPLINNLNKLLAKIDKYKPELYNKTYTDQHYRLTLKTIAELRFNYHLKEAERAKFKSQLKKALDHYYEALYLINTDETVSSIFSEKINDIERNINLLGGTLLKSPIQ